MIAGTVNYRFQPIVFLTVRGALGEIIAEALVDTGYNGSLTLSPAQISALGLVSVRSARITLADGTKKVVDAYSARIVWDGAERNTQVLPGDQALLGMSLVLGHEVRVQVVDGGTVSITRL